MSLFTQALTILVHSLSTPFENLLRFFVACRHEVAQRREEEAQWRKQQQASAAVASWLRPSIWRRVKFSYSVESTIN